MELLRLGVWLCGRGVGVAELEWRTTVMAEAVLLVVVVRKVCSRSI